MVSEIVVKRSRVDAEHSPSFCVLFMNFLGRSFLLVWGAVVMGLSGDVSNRKNLALKTVAEQQVHAPTDA